MYVLNKLLTRQALIRFVTAEDKPVRSNRILISGLFFVLFNLIFINQALALGYDLPVSFQLSNTSPTDVLVTDLDGDGNADMIFTMSGTRGGDSALDVNFGDGLGGLSSNATLPGGIYPPQGVTIADFNQDGVNDIATSFNTGIRGGVVIYLQGVAAPSLGNRIFFRAQIINIPVASLNAIVSADFNADGFTDLAVSSAARGGGLFILDGFGDGSFSAASGVPASISIPGTDLKVADFNNDKIADLVTPVSVYIGSKTGSFTRSSGLGGGKAVAIGDLNGDGITDTVSVGSTAIVTYIGNGDGTFRLVPVFFTINTNIQDVVIADVNADGIEDVIISKQIANGVNIEGSVDFYLGPVNMSTGKWSNHLTFAAGVNPVPLALGDFNSDGLLDYVTGNDDPVATNATYSLQISSTTQPGNVAPVASPLNLSTTATKPVSFTLSASDSNGDALIYSYTLPLQGGVLTGTAPNLIYTAPLGYVGTDTFTFTAQDPSLATSNVATVSITVTSLNTAPVITSQKILVTKEDTSITLTTNLFNIFDPDSTTFTLTVLSPLPGANYTVFANTITPAVNFNGLLTVPVTVSDNTNKISAVFNASVTVTPVNDAPVITGQSIISTAEDSPLTLKVNDFNITDPDSSLFTLHLPAPGAAANYTVLGTTITPVLNFNGILTVPVTVTDNTNNSSTVFNASVTVTPVNDAPVITGQGIISTAEDSPLTINVSDFNITDPDSSLFTLHLSTAGANYTVLGTTITPALNFNGTLTVPVTVTDNSNNHSIVFNAIVDVTPVNDAPVVTGQKLISIVEGQALNLSLKNVIFTDVDTVTGFTLKVLPATVKANYSVVGTTITPTALFNGVLSVPVLINDGLTNSKTYKLIVKVIAVNNPPVINGQSVLSTAEDSSLTLKVSDFTIIDPDSGLFTLQLSIPAVGANYTVQGSTLIPMANFNGTLVVPVLVNDGLSNSAVFNASVTITPVNDAPVSNAGVDQTTLVGNFVTLDGSGSTDIDGDTLTYYWWPLKFPVGATKTFSNVNGVTTNVNIDVPGVYTFRLYVNDGFVTSFSDMVVSTINSAPVANAGPDQTVAVGDIITLNGSASSDVDGDPLKYYWVLSNSPSGAKVIFSNLLSATTTTNIDIAGTYTYRLYVYDGTLFSFDEIVVTTLNAAPVANPGIYPSVFVGDTVLLDASASTDVNGDPLSYSWSLTTVPMGSLAAISNSSVVNPSFVVDKAGNYVAQLVVNDGKVNSIPVTTTISTQNSAPVANPGVDQTVAIGNLVTLDGSASSDADFDPLIYRWSLTTPVGSTTNLSDPFVINPTFTVDIKGDYVAQLIVNDGVVDSTPVTVLISTINTAPVADPGINLSAFAGDLISLDGSASFDADNDALSYRWSLTTPLGSTARLSDTLAVFPTFTADLPGTYVAQLIVNDGTVDSLPVTVSISVTAPINVNVNVFSLTWKGGDQQLIMTGDSDPATLEITYTSNGAPIMTINNSKGKKFESLANLSIAPCAITISTSTGAILLNNIAVSGASTNNCQ